MVKTLSDILEDLRNPSVLIIGPPRTGKEIFALQLLMEALERNEGVICILTNTFPEDFIEGMKIPEEKRKLLKLIDCYTYYTGVPAKESSMIYRVNGPSALNDMSLKISKSISELSKKTKRIKIIAYSISTLLTYNKLESITRFLQVVVGKVKATSGTSFFVVEEGMHNPQYVTAIASLTNVTLKLERKGGQNYLTIMGISFVKEPIKYKIIDKKIILGE